MSITIAGRGTTEIEWTGWLDSRTWPPVDLVTLPQSGRVCVIAAHPDDEVLGAAGLIGTLDQRGCEIAMVWATDGEASHPGTTVISPEALGKTRRSESRAALARLGVVPAATHHLGLPDGGLSASSEQLRDELARIVKPDELIIVPWEGDGHPDHKAVAVATRGLGARRWQYPVWMWHWAAPADSRVPWERVQTSEVPDLPLKACAIREFSTQVLPLGPGKEDAAILPPHVVARFLRRQEWFVV